MEKKLQEKKVFKIIIFAVILLIPVIYSFFYLKSYWNPYENLRDIKIAIVNLDGGTRGTELINNLKETENTFNFIETLSDDALHGISNDEYYAIITIPEDFTKSLESGKEKDKEKAIISFMPNKRKNYLAYQIINSGLKTAEIKIQSKVASEVVDTMSDKLKEVPDNLDKIDNGVGQIKDGFNVLSSGLKNLSTGINVLDTKYSEFDSGLKTATEGSKNLSNGIKQTTDGINTLQTGAQNLDDGIIKINTALSNLDTSKVADLTNGINSLNIGINGKQGLLNGINLYIDGVHTYENAIEEGANKLENGITQYIAGTKKLDQSQDQILQGIVNYYTAILNAGGTPDETLTKLAGGANQILNAPDRAQLLVAETQLKQGASNLVNANKSQDFSNLCSGENEIKSGLTIVAQGVTQLNNNTSQIQSLGAGIKALQTSLEQVQNGTYKLKTGIGNLKTGTEAIQEGSNSLSKGLGDLSSSSSSIQVALQQLDEGANSALNGGNKLTDGINTLKTSIDDGKNVATEQIDKLDGIKEFVEDPVEFKEESFGDVKSYGVAFTPLFLSIGLWVGALMLYVILYYDQKHRFGILDHENSNKILQNCIYLGIGAIEGLITGFILKVLLGFNVANIGIYLFECTLVGLTFTAIMQFLIRNFGDIGKFISLIILVLQLAASGGTFPTETIDKGFQIFTSWLPMTYTIKVFKDCLIQTDSSLIVKNTIVILSILIVLFITNTIIELIKNKFN